MGIQIEGFQQFSQEFAEIIKVVKKPRDVFRNVAQLMRRDVLNHFQKSQSPQGQWKALKFKRKDGTTKRPLIGITGDLTNSIRDGARFSDKGAEVGTDIIYAPIHNFGGQGGRGYIPQRQFMWLSKEGEDKTLDLFVIALKEAK